MLGMSSWMLLTAVPGPMLAWLGFAIVGGVSRSRRLIGLGVAAAAVAILAHLPFWGTWQPLIATIAYLAGMLVALMVNPGWLRTMWERRSGAATASAPQWHRRTTASRDTRGRGQRAQPGRRAASQRKQRRPAAKAPEAASGSTATQAADQSTAPDEATELAAAAGASTDRYLAPEPEPAEPVDVNTATVDELATLPGVTRSRARRAVKQRGERGGFASVDDFGEVVGLQPHEIVRLRRAATCSPRPRSQRRFGRRVDY
jgi:DNA uptake protein ComE-like DNA-binding protein